MNHKDALLPAEKPTVYSLVKQAGLDVRDWKKSQGKAKSPASNPKYCYEWAFSDPKGLIVLCLWHAELKSSSDGTVFQDFNARKIARERRGVVRGRAERMDKVLLIAHSKRLPVRVVITHGKRRGKELPRDAPSRVSGRLLDAAEWYIQRYNPRTGACRIVRGNTGSYVDQYSLESANTEVSAKVHRRKIYGTAYSRDSTVRKAVRERAKGRCEYCGQSGFLMPGGGVYLETHHIVPLSEGGKDSSRNVVALCPNHHREAHQGFDKKAMRKKLLEIVRA